MSRLPHSRHVLCVNTLPMYSRAPSNMDVASRRGAPPEVLIVEDERVSRRAMAALLAANGYHPEAVESGEEALRVVRRGGPPEIALVDFDLPGMNGLDFISRLSEMDPTVFTVLVTA